MTNDEFGLQVKTDDDSHPTVSVEFSERLTLTFRARICKYNPDSGEVIAEVWDREELQGVFNETGRMLERLKTHG